MTVDTDVDGACEGYRAKIEASTTNMFSAGWSSDGQLWWLEKGDWVTVGSATTSYGDVIFEKR